MFYPLREHVNRATAPELFGRGEYLPVFWHILAHHEARRMPLAVFEVLDVAATYRGPHAPGGRGLVYLQLLGHGLVRRVILVPVRHDACDGLDGLPDALRDRRLDSFGYEPRDEASHPGVVREGGDEAAVGVPLSGGLVQDGVRPDKAEDHGEVAPEPDRDVAHLLG